MKNINILRKKLLNKQIILLQGAMGTEILRRGIPTTLPLWSAEVLFSNPQIVEQIHIDYINAGAELISTNTFSTQRRTLTKVGKGNQARRLTILACRLAKDAVKQTGKKVFIAGSMSPLEDCYSPHLTPPNNELQKEHLEHAQNLKKGGVDFLLIETMITTRETLSAILAAKKVNLPFAVSFCCNDKFQLLSGESLEEVIEKIKIYKPLFISINCVDKEIVSKTIKKIKKITDLPLGVYAQGEGQPVDDQGWKLGQNKDGVSTYIKHAKNWIKQGVLVIGGCCGTTPEYTKALHLLINS